MFTAETQVRVRYGETDQMGIVYYGNYASYYEVARVECMRTLGLSYSELEAKGFMLPVLENHSKYLGPAKYDDLLTIKVSIRELPKVRIAFYCDIYNEKNELINEGKTILVFVDKETRKPCRIPEQMEILLSKYFNE